MRNDKIQTIQAAQRRLRRFRGRKVHTYASLRPQGKAVVRASVCEVI